MRRKFKSMQIINRATSFAFTLIKVIIFIAVVASAFWCKTVIYFFAKDLNAFQSILSWAFVFVWLGVFVLYPKILHSLVAYFVSVFVIFAIWASIPASNDRDWLAEYALAPISEYDGDDTVTISNIRDFEYHGTRDDFTPRYQTNTYNLDDLEGVDLILSHWSDNVMIAHTMLVFRFKDAENLVLSAETRREKGEAWGILPGFFNQYELIYLLGTEEDLIKRRILISDEDIFLYSSVLDHEKAVEFFKDTLRSIDELEKNPIFYNTLTHNCTSSLFNLVPNPKAYEWLNPELLLNGVSDKYLRRTGFLKGKGSYWEFKLSHYISHRIKDSPNKDGDFSELMREHIEE